MVIEHELLDELRAAFKEWYEAHGLVWFGDDLRLANAIAGVLHMLLAWEDDSGLHDVLDSIAEIARDALERTQ